MSNIHFKAAASNMLPDIQKYYKELIEVVRITKENIPEIKKEIGFLLNELIENKLIKNIPPSFYLGSTRLIALELGSWIKPHEPYETVEIYNKAHDIKKSFGDIDIDIHSLVSIKEIGEFLQNRYNKRISYRQCGENEINLAFLYDEKKVVQIDLIDITNNTIELGFNQFSSFIDITYQLKGLVREVLATSIAKTQPINKELKDSITQLVKERKQLIYEKCNTRDCDLLICDKIRWSLGHKYLKLIISYIKVKDGKTLKTPYNIEIDELHEQKNIHGKVLNISYTEIDTIAKEIGLSCGGVMYHAVLMLEEVKKFDIFRKQDIWNEFVKTINRKRPTLTAGGALSNEEADFTIEFIKPYFEGINYDTTNA